MNPYEADQRSADATWFASHACWKRITVVASGSLTNLIGGFLVLVALYAAGTHVPVPMTIGAVDPGSEAARAQLRPGDTIESAEGQKLEQWSSLVQLIADSPNRIVKLTFLRNGRHLEVAVRPRPDEQRAGRLGIAQQYVYRRYPVGGAIEKAGTHTLRLGKEGLAILARMLRGAGAAEVLRQSTHSARRDIDGFLRAMVNLSLLMAAFFLLPIPSLDGGRLLFLAIEAFRGKPVNPKLETAIHALGLLVLVAAILAIPAQRLARMWSERRQDVTEAEQPQYSEIQPTASDAGSPSSEIEEPAR
jgi:regulator of sigma E protease